ncbi:hypothetical protein BJX61DRAFT_493719 [Aspergillus egyptiacus]|nr:hypothetical protein BJX61DRAFT_493719 [Aspergillus egyptiacus]
MSNFWPVDHIHHLVVQPADAKLNPPEGYLYVQDGLIISCGVLYAFCYIFVMAQAMRERALPGSIKFLSLTLAYELYYAFATTSTTFERLCFLVWFELDLAFAAVAVRRIHGPEQGKRIAVEMAVYFTFAIAGLRYLGHLYPDDREQVTAYWTGILLQFPIGWVYVYRLLADGPAGCGQSLRLWLLRYTGCLTAYGVFIWRYLNVPQNWEYVASSWSIGIIVATLLPETVYPFVYIWVRGWDGEAGKVKTG